MTIGYLGPDGSFSRLAADSFRPQAQKRAYPSFRDLFEGLERGECDFIAAPIENSLNGGVLQNIDLLQSHADFFAFEQVAIKVDHRLALLKGADAARVTRIYSHQQAFAQCGEYLARNFPQAELIASPSTSAGLKLVRSKHEGAIVGSHVTDPRFDISPHNIADELSNVTSFLLIKKGGELPQRSSKLFFSATCPHRPGALVDLIKPIKEHGFNMTKIESRPIRERPGEYRFFIETEGDSGDKKALAMLEAVKGASASFRLLGCY